MTHSAAPLGLILSLRSFILDDFGSGLRPAPFRLQPRLQSRVTRKSLHCVPHPLIDTLVLLSSLLFLELKQSVVERGGEVGVGNLTDGEVVEHAKVLLDLVRLVLLNGHVPVVDRNEVDELAVVLDLVGQGFDVLLVLNNVLLDRAL